MTTTARIRLDVLFMMNLSANSRIDCKKRQHRCRRLLVVVKSDPAVAVTNADRIPGTRRALAQPSACVSYIVSDSITGFDHFLRPLFPSAAACSSIAAILKKPFGKIYVQKKDF